MVLPLKSSLAPIFYIDTHDDLLFTAFKKNAHADDLAIACSTIDRQSAEGDLEPWKGEVIRIFLSMETET